MVEVSDIFATFDWLRDPRARDSSDPRAREAFGWITRSDQLVDWGGDDRWTAIEGYRKALTVFEKLAVEDHPHNLYWQSNVGLCHARIGGILEEQGDLAAALESYRDVLVVAEHLAKADPDNTECQRDLTSSRGKIGDVQLAQGDLVAALESYRAAFVIAQHLAIANQDNAEWQRDLSGWHAKIGDVRHTQGDLIAALASYRAAFVIAERLAKIDPSNQAWGNDVAWAQKRLVNLELLLGRRQSSGSVSEQSVQNSPVSGATITPAGERGSPRPRQSSPPLAKASHEVTRSAQIGWPTEKWKESDEYKFRGHDFYAFLRRVWKPFIDAHNGPVTRKMLEAADPDAAHTLKSVLRSKPLPSDIRILKDRDLKTLVAQRQVAISYEHV
jgi:tetratricopeptide (TPR) repeat protein